jgi:deoxyribonuclease V
MLACLDVAYRGMVACAAAVTFRDWADGTAAGESVVLVQGAQPYEPGEFFRRELPCLLAVLRTLPPLEAVLIDGYVWDGAGRPGLGAHLFHALDTKVPVIGVAKSKFQGAGRAWEVFRGRSKRPLFVTAAGMPEDVAAERVRSMHGNGRIPTLLARADSLSRRGTKV